MPDPERLQEIISNPDDHSTELVRKAEAYVAGVPPSYASDAEVFANMTLLEISEELSIPWANLLRAISVENDGRKERKSHPGFANWDDARKSLKEIADAGDAKPIS